MAVPTITTITPNNGSTLGSELVEIYGTNFRTPVIPDTIPAPVQPPTVEVLFGGVKARRVGVANDNRLLVFTPPHAEATSGGNVAGVDVVVRNIDDNGDPIAGEEATAAAAFTYQLPNLHNRTTLQFFVEYLMTQLIEQVHPEIILAQHTDWDDAPDGMSLQPVAKYPAIVLDGPELSENRFYSRNRFTQQDVDGAEEFAVKREPRTVDVGFGVLVLSDNTQEILNLSNVFTQWMHLNKVFFLPCDPDDPTGEAFELELDFQPGGDLKWAGEPNEDNLRQMRGSILIRGFDIVDGPSFTKGAALGAKNGDPDVILESPSQLPETTEDGDVTLPISGLTTSSPADC